MIVYQSTKTGFLRDVRTNQIDQILLERFASVLGWKVGKSEQRSWSNSLMFMGNLLSDTDIPEDAGVAIEYCLPTSQRKRIDFILTGYNSSGNSTAVIVELKQWETVNTSEVPNLISTFVGTLQDVPHPSYQAWSYACVLEDFNDAVQRVPIILCPCAYLHNCISDSVLRAPIHQETLKLAPLFLKKDADLLLNFLKDRVQRGDKGEALEAIDTGRIRPSKNLADALASMLNGNPEFVLLDDQKVVYETGLHLAQQATPKQKQVLIVHGGPGTGKTVVAINLMVALTSRGQVTKYVSRNAAPRAVYEAKLTGSMTKSRISDMFVGSGGFTEIPTDPFDSLLVDETHRLTEKSGLYSNLGQNQVMELIRAANFTVFFLDEDQQVTFNDIGSSSEIRKWAGLAGAIVTEQVLESQFRCNGSDGYLAWVDNLLQIRPTSNTDLTGIDYDFGVFDDPNLLRSKIEELNKPNNSARLLAGYCWNWRKNEPEYKDISIPEHGFAAKWNLTAHGSLWLIKPESISEVGCIHTSQGLELDYVGVIFGPDLVVRDGVVITRPQERAKTDQSLKGYKKAREIDADAADAKADRVIKNTYRALMTRGKKGCFVFSTDPETNEYLKMASIRSAS